MKFRLIKTEEDYKSALEYLEVLGDNEDFETSKELGEEFELISTLISLYDKENFPLERGAPIDIIKLKMNYLGLSRKDLNHIASSGVLSEVFSGKRGLSKQMIREFSTLLGIDQGLLNADYSNDNNVIVKISKSESPFKFISKANRPNLIRFKRRVGQKCMLLNVNCSQ